MLLLVLCEKKEEKKENLVDQLTRPSRHFFRLDWAGRPRLLPTREQLIGGKGGSVELYCPHVGDPPIHIIWSKEGEDNRTIILK